jgi:hypothetical protein
VDVFENDTENWDEQLLLKSGRWARSLLQLLLRLIRTRDSIPRVAMDFKVIQTYHHPLHIRA